MGRSRDGSNGHKNLELVDLICASVAKPLGEPRACFQLSLSVPARAGSDPFSRGTGRPNVSGRGTRSHPHPKEKRASDCQTHGRITTPTPPFRKVSKEQRQQNNYGGTSAKLGRLGKLMGSFEKPESRDKIGGKMGTNIPT